MSEMMIRAYLGLGGNLDDPAGRIREALRLLDDCPELCLVKTASFYRTEPVGPFAASETTDARRPGWFVNTVAAIDTSFPAPELLRNLLEVERLLGRVRPGGEGYYSRTLDIDLLFYGKEIFKEPSLEVPHPRLHERAFVLAPLLDLAPDLRHPVLQKTILELYARLDPSQQRVEALLDEPPSESARVSTKPSGSKILVSASFP